MSMICKEAHYDFSLKLKSYFKDLIVHTLTLITAYMSIQE